MLLSVALMGLPALVLGASPAAATDYYYTSEVTVHSTAVAPRYGSPFKLEGQVVADDGAGGSGYLTGVTVVLSRQWKGSDAWTEIGTATTDATTGNYVFQQTAEKNATYKVTYAGETIPQGSDNVVVAGSEATKVQNVMRHLHDKGVKKSGKLFLVGNVDPGWGGKPILLQRRSCLTCQWKAVDKQRTSSNGAFRFRMLTRSGGDYYYRAKVAGTTDYVTSYSDPWRVYRTY